MALEIIFRYIIPEKKTTAHQLYSHSGYHIIQDPIKTSSTSIQLTCIFWPQYPTLPHKTSKILLVLSSSRRSLSFSPLSSADLPKWVKRGETLETSNSKKAPRSLRQKPGIEALGFMSKCWTNKRFWSFNVFYQKQKKTHTHTYINLKSLWRPISTGHSFSFQKRVSTPNLRSCSERRCRIWATDLKVGGLLVTVTSHWPSIKGSPTGSWKTNRKCSKYKEIGRVVGFVFWNAKDQFLWEPLGAAAVEVVWRMGQNGKRSGDWYRFWSLLVDILKMD